MVFQRELATKDRRTCGSLVYTFPTGNPPAISVSGELKHGRQEQYNLLTVDFSLYLLFPFLPSKQQLHATERFACTQLVCHLRKASTQTVENTILFSGLVGTREAPAKLTSYLRHCLPSYWSTSHQADVMSATMSLRPTGSPVTKRMSYFHQG